MTGDNIYKFDDLEKIVEGKNFQSCYPYDYIYGNIKTTTTYALVENNREQILFERLVGENTLKKIIDNILYKLTGEKKLKTPPLVNFIDGGFSGAFVFVVTYKTHTGKPEKNILVKINKHHPTLEKEAENTNYQLPPNFIGKTPEMEAIVIDNYYCLTFKFKPYKNLRHYIRKDINAVPRKQVQNILKAFEAFETEEGNCDALSLNPWDGTPHKKNKYYPIKPDSSEIKVIRAQLTDFMSFSSSYLKKIKVTISDLEALDDYVSGKELGGQPLLQKNNYIVPVNIAHGDFHSGNILVNEELGDPHFIDFALVASDYNANALLDYGKLAVDFEMQAIPNSILFDNPKYLNEWLQANYTFFKYSIQGEYKQLKSKIDGLKNENIRSLYYLCYTVFQHTISKFSKYKSGKNSKFKKADIALCFHLIRLRYLLKQFIYPGLSREKAVFIIKASLFLFKGLKKVDRKKI